ncbi:MAG: sodium:solute symporter [Acidobacteriota bacterium]
MVSGAPTVFLVVLAAYTLAIMGIALWAYRKTHTETDFLVAGRSVGAVVGGATLAATQMSSGTVVGTVGFHYLTGVSWAWIWPGVWLGWVIAAVWVAPKLRAFGGVTVPDFIAVRFASEKARVLSAVLIVLAYSIYLSAQYQAGGIIFQALFTWPYATGVLLVAGLTIGYTWLGGMRSSIYTDFAQALLMAMAFLVAVPLIWHRVGGLTLMGQLLAGIDPRLPGWYFGGREILVFSLAFGLSIATAPYQIARIYALRDVATVRLAIGIAFVFQALLASAVLITGLGMRALFPVLPNADLASSVMALQVLPPLAGSLLLVGALSAIMSTCDSIMIICAAGISHDLYGNYLRPQATEKQKLSVNRWSVLLIGSLPVTLAFADLGLVQEVVVDYSKVIASFFFVPVILGLNWRRGTTAGAMASMSGGFLAFWLWRLPDPPYPWGLDPIFSGIAASLILFVSVSWVSRPVPATALAPFFPTASSSSAAPTAGGR